jgi:hypothetical protein
MTTATDDLLTEIQAANLLKIKPGTLNSWRCLGRHALPYIRVGHAIRYRRSDLERWLVDRTVTSTSADA